MSDIVCLGEALVDLVPTETGLDFDGDTYVRAAGGAPANVAVGLRRLGASSGFVGTVGDDGFGRFLTHTLDKAGVDRAGLRVTTRAPTALTAVTLSADGNREFVFYGNPAAHSLLAPDDIDESVVQAAKILHFGSISLIDDPARAATLHAIDIAHEHNRLVSYDPNLRLPLWPNAEAARTGLRLGLSKADIVKISEEEVAFLTSACDLVEGARALWHPRLKVMTVTRGARGCIWLNSTTQGEEAGFAVRAIDTTGAGDAFMAGLLAGFVDRLDLADDPIMLTRAIRFANATGALATTKRGAIPSLPDRNTVERFLRDRAGIQTHRDI